MRQNRSSGSVCAWASNRALDTSLEMRRCVTSSCNSLALTRCSRSPLLAQICLGLHAYSLA